MLPRGNQDQSLSPIELFPSQWSSISLQLPGMTQTLLGYYAVSLIQHRRVHCCLRIYSCITTFQTRQSPESLHTYTRIISTSQLRGWRMHQHTCVGVLCRCCRYRRCGRRSCRTACFLRVTSVRGKILFREIRCMLFKLAQKIDIPLFYYSFPQYEEWRITDSSLRRT